MTILERGSISELYACYDKDHPCYHIHDCIKDFFVYKGKQYQPDVLRYQCFGFRKATAQEVSMVFKPLKKEKLLYKQEEQRRFCLAAQIASSSSRENSPLIWDLVYNWPLQNIKKEVTTKRITTEKAKNAPIEEIYDGELRPNGGNRLLGLCPFHAERTPSFVIYKNTNRFYCFGCQKSGDVITFFMEKRNCDFTSAIKELNKYAISK